VRIIGPTARRCSSATTDRLEASSDASTLAHVRRHEREDGRAPAARRSHASRADEIVVPVTSQQDVGRDREGAQLSPETVRTHIRNA